MNVQGETCDEKPGNPDDIVIAAAGFGCGQDRPVSPNNSQVVNESPGDRQVAPSRHYTHTWTQIGVSVDTRDVIPGEGVPFLDGAILDDYGEEGIVASLGITFDPDRTMYAIVGWLGGTSLNLAKLATIDMNNGEATIIAETTNYFFGRGVDVCVHLRTADPEPPAHLAHGDYVYGSAGHDCDCR